MNKRYFALTGLLIAMSVNAEPYFLATVGRATAQPSNNNGNAAWQQPGFPHSEQYKTRALSIGLGYDLNKSLSIETRYVSHGLVKQKGDWVYTDKGDVNPECYCRGSGSARVTGLTLAGIGRYYFTKDFSAGFEGGLFRWRALWTEKMRFDGQDRYATHYAVKGSGTGALTGLILGYKQFDLRYEIFGLEPRNGSINKQVVVSGGYRVEF